MTISTASPVAVVVFGATGQQGGSVARSLLRNDAFRVRAITRNPESNASQELKALGAEVIKADGWNQQEVTQACQGAGAAFINTNSDDPAFMDNGLSEFDLGKTMVDAVIDAGTVQHLIYSSAVSTAEVTGGRICTTTTEMKARIERYAKEAGHFQTVNAVHAGWYLELFLNPDVARVFGGFPHFPDQEGLLTLQTPRWGSKTDMGVPWLSVQEDFGDLVHGLLLSPEEYQGHAIPAFSDLVSFPDVAEAFEAATGKATRYIPLSSPEEFGAGIPQLEDQRRLFALGQLTNGNYFGDGPGSTSIAARLKARAVQAQNRSSRRAELITVRQWFEDHFRVDH